jgi:Flp pilus assembly protein CpaB
MENILSNRLLTTRRGTVIVGIGAAMLAAVILLVYLSQYRSNLRKGATPVTVLVAKRLIEKNTSGDLVGTQELFVPTTIPQGQLREGAISDPIALRDKVAVADIYPGQQLTTTDFVPATGLLVNRLARDKRAIAIPTDAIHGLVGHVQTGDHVDIYVAFNSSRGASIVSLLLKDVPVLSAPGAAGGGVVAGRSAGFIVQATDQTAPELAFAADYGKIWFVLRPPNPSATRTRDAIVSGETILLGIRPAVNAQRVRVRGR